MNRKIRNSVFETNSSSVHSVIIGSKDYSSVEIFKPDKSMTVKFSGGEFGWSYDILSSSYEKANYIAVYLMLYDKDESRIKMFEEVVKEMTTAQSILYEFMDSNGDSEDSYIDHQGYEDSDWNCLFTEKAKLKEFIFNTKYSIMIANDNSEFDHGVRPDDLKI